jgi:hypothetical protein
MISTRTRTRPRHLLICATRSHAAQAVAAEHLRQTRPAAGRHGAYPGNTGAHRRLKRSTGATPSAGAAPASSNSCTVPSWARSCSQRALELKLSDSDHPPCRGHAMDSRHRGAFSVGQRPCQLSAGGEGRFAHRQLHGLGLPVFDRAPRCRPTLRLRLLGPFWGGRRCRGRGRGWGRGWGWRSGATAAHEARECAGDGAAHRGCASVSSTRGRGRGRGLGLNQQQEAVPQALPFLRRSTLFHRPAAPRPLAPALTAAAGDGLGRRCHRREPHGLRVIPCQEHAPPRLRPSQNHRAETRIETGGLSSPRARLPPPPPASAAAAALAPRPQLAAPPPPWPPHSPPAGSSAAPPLPPCSSSSTTTPDQRDSIEYQVNPTLRVPCAHGWA